jgi:HEPN domain-containing protein
MKLKDIEHFWLNGSEEDFDTAQLLFEKGKYVNSMFFIHLSIEKLLKALLVNKNGKEPPFSHNLVKLASLVHHLELNIETQNLLADITSFNISSRYDDYKNNFHEICNREFALEYITKTRSLISWIKSRMI